MSTPHTGGGNAKGTRRAFGTTRVLPSKRVQARYTGPDGKIYSAPTTFQTKTDAGAWLLKEARRVQAGTWEPPKAVEKARIAKVTMTVREYGEKVIARRKLRETTRSLYTRLFARSIAKTLGDRTLSSVTLSDVKDWYASLAAKPTEQANAYGLLKSIFKEAIEDELIDRNPCRITAGSSKSRAKEPTALTVKELAAYTKAVPEKYRMALTLAGWCGLRSGEVRGLRRRDLDLNAGVVRVSQQAVKVKGERQQLAKPKTKAGVRVIALPPHLVPVLTEWLKGQPVKGRDGLLFAAGDGVTPLADSVLREAHEKAREAIGKPDLTIHGLRHTAATLTAQAGATTSELMARFGWDTPSMAARYTHAAAERDQALAAKLSEMTS